MVGFDPRSAPLPESEHEPAHTQPARSGLVLFAFYVMLYAGFVLLNAFAPRAMEQTPWAGVNLAVLYGLALIAAAFVLALCYDWLCRARDPRDGEGGQ